MALVRPVLSDAQLHSLSSRAEARFYEACRDLVGKDVLVLHSVAWAFKRGDGRLSEGEADFTFAFFDSGVLTVEVKGGGVAFDAADGRWSSLDRHGVRNPIKDPFRQAARERYALVDQLTGHPKWRKWQGKRLVAGHAVFLPDVEDIGLLVHAERPRQIIGGRADLRRLDTWLQEVMSFWMERETMQPLGRQGVRLVEEILCSSIEVQPVLRAVIDDAEVQRIRLTERQAKILRVIGGRKRAVIAGGAGTGKTLLAVEKARQLAALGKKVMLLCYNRPLADALAKSLAAERDIHAMNFHQLCEQRIAAAFRLTGSNLLAEATASYPGTGERHKFEVQMPFALALSNELLGERYDAIVVDEAQDFSDEYWFAVEELLTDQENGCLYVFTDPNQSLYRRHANLPVADEPFYLTANCRNTSPIHDLAYAYYEGEAVDRPELPGPEVQMESCETDVEQANAIATRCRQLVMDEKVKAEDVVVLLAKRPKAQLYGLLESAGRAKGIVWAFEEHDHGPGAILVDTVARFKGLEAAVVVLWVGLEICEPEERETVYVGTSRAKSLLQVVGSRGAIECLQLIGGHHETGR